MSIKNLNTKRLQYIGTYINLKEITKYILGNKRLPVKVFTKEEIKALEDQMKKESKL